MLFLLFKIIFTSFLILLLVFIIADVSNFLFRKTPPLPTSANAIKFILKILEKRKKGTFVDLGCGRGKVLFAVKKKYPEIIAIGYEDWFNQFFLAKLLNFIFRTKIKFFFKNLFSANLKETDVVFCYLDKDLMPRLEKKLNEELKNGATVIASTFPFPNWESSQIIVTRENMPHFEKLFIYERGKNPF